MIKSRLRKWRKEENCSSVNNRAGISKRHPGSNVDNRWLCCRNSSATWRWCCSLFHGGSVKRTWMVCFNISASHKRRFRQILTSLLPNHHVLSVELPLIHHNLVNASNSSEFSTFFLAASCFPLRFPLLERRCVVHCLPWEVALIVQWPIDNQCSKCLVASLIVCIVYPLEFSTIPVHCEFQCPLRWKVKIPYT